MRPRRPGWMPFLAIMILDFADVRASDPLPEETLRGFVAAVVRDLPRAGAGGFVEPSDRELDRFAEALGHLLQGETAPAEDGLLECGYELRRLEDRAAGKVYLVAREVGERRGQGTFIVDPSPERELVVGVPHPLHDVGTPAEGRALFQALAARCLFIAGAHRCAAASESPCSGETEACGGGPPRTSDAAHNVRTFFQSAHRAALALEPRPTILSLHGQASEDIDVIASDGTSVIAPPGAPVNRLRAALIGRGVPATSCNRPEDPASRLCGTTNVQGRLANGSSDPCLRRAAAATGLFLHLEQSRAVRKDPAELIEALKEVFPPRGR